MNVSAKQSLNYTVRQIESYEDTIHVMRMAEDFAATAGPDEEVVPDRVQESCIRIRVSDRSTVNLFIVSKYDADLGQPVPCGFLVGVCNDLWYNCKKCAEQKLWYVEKAHRHTIAPKLLIDAYEAWALSLGASRIYTGSANIRYSETISRTLTKLGYAHVGGTFVKEFD